MAIPPEQPPDILASEGEAGLQTSCYMWTGGFPKAKSDSDRWGDGAADPSSALGRRVSARAKWWCRHRPMPLHPTQNRWVRTAAGSRRSVCSLRPKDVVAIVRHVEEACAIFMLPCRGTAVPPSGRTGQAGSEYPPREDPGVVRLEGGRPGAKEVGGVEEEDRDDVEVFATNLDAQCHCCRGEGTWHKESRRGGGVGGKGGKGESGAGSGGGSAGKRRVGVACRLSLKQARRPSCAVKRSRSGRGHLGRRAECRGPKGTEASSEGFPGLSQT